MKKTIIILLMIFPFLTSCVAQKSKEAYCFSIVFDRSNDKSYVTLYCKTQKDSNSTDMKDVTLKYAGDTFPSAMKESSKGDYNVYFNSICAYYLSNTLTGKDILEISLELLNNAEYKTDNLILSGTNIPTSKLHEYANETCKSESIQKSTSELYTPTLKFLRKRAKKS